MKGFSLEEITKMDAKTRAEKLKELKLSLVRASVRGRETKIRTKEIKKAIARVLTVTNMEQKGSMGTA